MFDKIRLLAFVTCALFIYSSVPAHAGPKDDCEKGLKQAEKDLGNSVFDVAVAKSVRQVLGGARLAQKEGKFKACVKRVNSAKNKMGTK